MSVVVRLYEAGAPTVLKVEHFDDVSPGAGDVRLEQEAIGVNYLDVTQRNGAVPIALPSGLGLEGAGRVTAVGADVAGVAIGDRVAYALGPIGSYASSRLYPAERLVKLPDAMSCEDAAAILFKGLTAQYLIKSTFPVGPGSVVVLYGAAGPVGSIVASWATHLGADVIGVVSRETSVDRARAAGCRDVLIWGKSDITGEVNRLTGGRMADVVYDGVGRATFDASIDILKIRGTMVSFGASSGVPDPVSLATLNKKSLFLTRPGLAAHVSNLAEYRERAKDVLDAVDAGVINPSVWKVFPLDQVIAAHTVLEHGQAEGALILKP